MEIGGNNDMIIKQTGEPIMTDLRLHQIPGNKGFKPQILSTMGIRVITYITLLSHSVTRMDPKIYRDFCTQVTMEHYRRYKDGHYINHKKKKMTPDKIWYNNIVLGANPSVFNSGAKNTGVILNQLRQVIEDVKAKSAAAYKERFLELHKLYYEMIDCLYEHNFNTRDAYEENVGIKDGRMVLIDLGMSL